MSDLWERRSSELLADYGFFKLRQDVNRHPRHGRDHRFFIFEFPDWVNIIPITADGDVIFVQQFRHGTRELTLEVPGGIVDPGETPKESALRELFEESGYRPQPDGAVELGWVHPNPALQENRCWSYLAQNVEKVVAEDHIVGTSSEAIEVFTIPLSEVPGMISRAEITHALTIAAFDHHNRWLASIGD